MKILLYCIDFYSQFEFQMDTQFYTTMNKHL